MKRILKYILLFFGVLGVASALGISISVNKDNDVINDMIVEIKENISDFELNLKDNGNKVNLLENSFTTLSSKLEELKQSILNNDEKDKSLLEEYNELKAKYEELRNDLDEHFEMLNASRKNPVINVDFTDDTVFYESAVNFPIATLSDEFLNLTIFVEILDNKNNVLNVLPNDLSIGTYKIRYYTNPTYEFNSSEKIFTFKVIVLPEGKITFTLDDKSFIVDEGITWNNFLTNNKSQVGSILGITNYSINMTDDYVIESNVAYETAIIDWDTDYLIVYPKTGSTTWYDILEYYTIFDTYNLTTESCVVLPYSITSWMAGGYVGYDNNQQYMNSVIEHRLYYLNQNNKWPVLEIFYIDDSMYYFVSGSSFTSWLDSSYNTKSFYIETGASGVFIRKYSGSTETLYLNDVKVDSIDIIEPGSYYYFK